MDLSKYPKEQQMKIWREIAKQKRDEFVRLLQVETKDKKIAEIPMEVLEKANRLMKDAQIADKKYLELTEGI